MTDSCDNITGYNEIMQTCKKMLMSVSVLDPMQQLRRVCGPFGRPGKHGVKTYTLIEGTVRQRAVQAFPLRGAGTKRLFEDVSSCSADDSMEPQRKWRFQTSWKPCPIPFGKETRFQEDTLRFFQSHLRTCMSRP